MNENYFLELIQEYVMPGMAGGFVIFFSTYLLSLGISLAYKLLKS